MNNYFHNRKGVTLVELIITIAIFSLVISIIFSMNIFGIRSFALSRDSADSQFEVRMPTDFIAKKIRYANSIKILSTIPTTPTPNSHQIYLENGEIIYKDAGSDSLIIGTSNVDDYTLLFEKTSNNMISYTIGKSGTTKFNLKTEVVGLNLDKIGITGDTNGIYVEFFTDNADGVTPVSIVSLADPPTAYAQLNTAVSTPLRVTATMSDGSTRKVAARWTPSTIDTSTTGMRTSVGRVVGYNGTATFTVVVGNYTISNIDDITISINQGQLFAMPDYVTAESSDGSNTFTHEVPVLSWDTMITSTIAGTFTAQGTVDGYKDIDGNLKEFTLTVIVNALSITDIADITATVNQGVSYTPPTEVAATMSDGSTNTYPITWSPLTIDTSTYGTKYATGTVVGYSNPVNLTLTVIQSKIPKPVVAITKGGKNGTIKVIGLAGATATITKNGGGVVGTGIIGVYGEVEITVVNTNNLDKVVLSKTGWLNSDPYIF
ncbi:Ig-like domain-containing protein [Gudongella oleilytica]|uniref:Ig-like domain-containing protein n=1 Tax=Gudongella oleilytica TaxID=1582259 RepID=UPI000FF89BFD|nr:Ig-like domain-containing protein [Gudongella oleilytica]